VKSKIETNEPTLGDSQFKASIIGGGEMGNMIRSRGWSSTTLGDPQTWPECLPYSLNIMLNTSVPMCIWWGKEELISFYNDAFKNTLGNKQADGLGQSAVVLLPDLWDALGPLACNVFETGKPFHRDNVRRIINSKASKQELYLNFACSPIFDSVGSVEGLLCTISDTTSQTLRQQELEESDARFRNLADSAPTYIAMADENGNAVYFNKPWLEFTGKKLKQMVGLGWLSTLHPEDAPKFETDFKDAFQKQIPINKEYRFRRADGEYRWMLAIGAPRFTPDKHFIGYFKTYTDFHELKTAQLALKESEERFRTLIEKSADAVQLVSPEGEILFTSDSVENVLGYKPDELAHEGLTPYLHPEDTEYFFKHFSNLILHPGKQVVLQYRVKHKDGSWAWLETIGVNHLKTPYIKALVGNFRNITVQKEAECKLRDSEQRFRALADNTPNLAWMAMADGYIYWYNNRWYEYTGTSPKEMEGWGWQSVHDPACLPDVLAKWKRSIKSRKTFEMVFLIKGSDAVFRPFLTRVVPVMSPEGKVIQWIGTNTDITHQLKIKQTEAENERLEEITRQLTAQRQELIELNRAKEEFISLASHQLRTPASGVKQYLGMLLGGYAGELTPLQKDYAEKSYESNEREITIINDLLQVAQVDAGKMKIHKKKVNFVALISEILDEQKSNFEDREQKIIYRHNESKITTNADRDRIRMVLENLIDNASKYTGPQTAITVTLTKLKDNQGIQIKINDQGVGIPKEHITKIFDKFVRIDNSRSISVGGSGLGLYLVKKIMDLHDGIVKVNSTPGKGTTFTLSLPSAATAT